jgi:hypothetical protein
MRGIRLAMGLVGVLGLAGTAAAADDSSFYVGGGVGLYNAQVDHPINASIATGVGVNCSVLSAGPGSAPLPLDTCTPCGT